MPDACVPAVQAFAARHEADAGPLLGFVMAHELGRLLLGPGHAGDGVMRKGVGSQKTEALRRDGPGSTLRTQTESGASCWRERPPRPRVGSRSVICKGVFRSSGS